MSSNWKGPDITRFWIQIYLILQHPRPSCENPHLNSLCSHARQASCTESSAWFSAAGNSRSGVTFPFLLALLRIIALGRMSVLFPFPIDHGPCCACAKEKATSKMVWPMIPVHTHLCSLLQLCFIGPHTSQQPPSCPHHRPILYS